MDITAVVNAHNEGILLASTLRSVRLAKEHAESHGNQVEVIVVLDRASQDTVEFLANQEILAASLVTTEVGDLGQSRNVGANAASGEFLAFLDGDDLWGETWLTAAASAARRDSRAIVWHPAVNVYFPINPVLFFHKDMEEPDFDVWGLVIQNHWTALSFARRSLYVQYPYPAISLSEGLGFEDWSWNCNTIAGGVLHKVVPETTHFVRQKRESLLSQTHARGSVMVPSQLFNELIARRGRAALRAGTPPPT